MGDHASSMTKVLAAAAMGLTVLATGCRLFQKQSPAGDAKSPAVAAADPKPAKPGVPVATLVSSWSRKVEMGTNPVDNAPMPALVGRLYLLDAKDQAVEADGKLSVELFDDTNRRLGKPCERLGNWNIDPASLTKMQSRDAVMGVGYSLALPWPSYKPETTQVHMVIHYTPRSGQPLSRPDETITLEQSPELLYTRQQSATQPTGAVPASAAK